jgi:hypothetical protein
MPDLYIQTKRKRSQQAQRLHPAMDTSYFQDNSSTSVMSQTTTNNSDAALFSPGCSSTRTRATSITSISSTRSRYTICAGQNARESCDDAPTTLYHMHKYGRDIDGQEHFGPPLYSPDPVCTPKIFSDPEILTSVPVADEISVKSPSSDLTLLHKPEVNHGDDELTPTTPTQGTQSDHSLSSRYYPPNSFRMEIDEDAPIPPNYAPRSPLHEIDSERLREVRQRAQKLSSATVKSQRPALQCVTPQIPRKPISGNARQVEQHETARGRPRSRSTPASPVDQTTKPAARAPVMHSTAYQPPTRRRRRSSVDRFMDAAKALKDSTVKVGEVIKTRGRRLTDELKRLTISHGKEASSEQLAQIEKQDQAASVASFLNNHPSQPLVKAHKSQLQDSELRANVHQLFKQPGAPRAHPKRRNESINLPSAADVYGKLTYFAHCPHTHPPRNLPLNKQPKDVVLREGVLNYPTDPTHRHTLSLQAQGAHPAEVQLSVINSRCDACDYAHHRSIETMILSDFDSAYIPLKVKHQSAITELQAMERAPVREAEREREYIQGQIDAWKKQIRELKQAKENDLWNLWSDYTPRWGVALEGIVRGKEGAGRPRTARSGSVDSAGTTGVGFMRNSAHGLDPNAHVEEGRMRLSWTAREGKSRDGSP